MKCKFKVHLIMFFTFFSSTIKPALRKNHDLATTVQVMLKDLKNSTPDHFWLNERLKFIKEQNTDTTSQIFLNRQRYLARKIQELHPKQD